MNENITAILKSLENDADSKVHDPKQSYDLKSSLVVRFIDSRAAIPIFLGVDPKRKTRYLFIHIKEKLKSNIVYNLPTWNGMTINQDKTSIPFAGYRNEWFLVLSHQVEYDHKIFEAVIESICDDLLSLSQYIDMLPKLQRNLQRWKSFFGINGWDGLSESAQLGLFGELWVLRELLQSNSNVVENWIGPEKEPNDFLKAGVGIEVKAITSKKHYKVVINNEKQLDDVGFKSLYLLAIVMRKVDSGETLNELIKSIRRVLNHAPYMLNVFDEKLFMAGYLDNHSNLYDTGYILQEVLSYNVNEGFPRLLSKELKNGVGDLKYTVDLSACEPFKVNFNEIINSYGQIEEK